MRNIFFLIVVIFTIFNCKDNTHNNTEIEILHSEGMEGKPEIIYFINENVGYAFNNSRASEPQTDEQLNDPNFFPKAIDIATVYKTLNAGKDWKKVAAISQRKFFSKALRFENSLFVETNDFYNDKVYIAKLDIVSDTIVFEKEFNMAGDIFTDNKNIFLQSANKYSVIKYDKNLVEKGILNASIGTNSLFVKETLYTIPRDNEGHNYLKAYTNNIPETIGLSIEPECIIRQNNNNIMIAGTNSDGVNLVDYDIKNNKSKILKVLKEYSLVRDLQSDGNVICGFVGNIKGNFTEYDLIYSVDQGKNWQIQKLKENSYVRPNMLINRVLYIYSGGSRIQKVLFK